MNYQILLNIFPFWAIYSSVDIYINKMFIYVPTAAWVNKPPVKHRKSVSPKETETMQYPANFSSPPWHQAMRQSHSYNVLPLPCRPTPPHKIHRWLSLRENLKQWYACVLGPGNIEKNVRKHQLLTHIN